MNLSSRLFFSHVLVVATGLIMLAVVLSLVAPADFSRRMMNPPPNVGQGVGNRQNQQHMMELDAQVQDNFRGAVNTALLSAALAAVVTAGLVSWWMSRRIVHPISAVVAMSQHIADGHYQQRLTVTGHDELAELIQSFNRMAIALEETETMRRALLADVTHELKTPLTSIKGYMEGLTDGVIPATPETYHTIHREADRLQRLVLDLQELSRVEANQVTIHATSQALEPIVEAVITRMRPQFDEKAIELKVAIDKVVVVIDRDRTEQILTNLLGNALQHTGHGGHVTITSQIGHQHVKLSVQDDGTGIAPQDLERIFQRFYRVDKSRARASGGSGIGLTIARHLAEAQGGTLIAESAGLGKGSRFTLSMNQAG